MANLLSHKRGRICGKGAMIQDQRATLSKTTTKNDETFCAFDLQSCFQGVDGCRPQSRLPNTIEFIFLLKRTQKSVYQHETKIVHKLHELRKSSWEKMMKDLRMRKMRHAAAHPEAAAVLIPTGRFCVESNESSKVSIPELAAVSPKRERGPWKSAGPTPR